LADFRQSPRRRERLLAAAALAIATAARGTAAAARRALPLRDVEALLAAGRLDEIMRRYRVALESLLQAAQAAAVDSAAGVADEMAGQLGLPIALDLSRDPVARALRDQRQRIVSGLVEAQRAAVLAALSTAMRAGRPVADQARAVRDSLGLSAAQVAALARYRSLVDVGARAALERRVAPDLDRELRDAVDAGQDPPQGLEARLGESYRTTLLFSGAALLGDLLGAQALALGTTALLDQALDDGLLDPLSLEDTWWTRSDERVRESHRFMHGQVRPHGDPFRSGAGNSLAYPGDPSAPLRDTINCRCFVTTRATSAVAPSLLV
jgi:hypothetical protein